MSKSNKKKQVPFSVGESQPAEQSSSHGHALRESIESIVVAFVLAFLFRTFEAEAFIIPTGSMSPSLLGMHKDVECTQCGHRFRVTASSEDPDEASQRPGSPEDWEVVGGVCPMCRYTMPFRTDGLTPNILNQIDADDVEFQKSYPGDRILVNKYGFGFNAPERWDVVVFKFPGNGDMNYIKRLVGLPNERLMLYQGDVFTKTLEGDDEYQIARKPAEKVAAMLQPVHDTAHEPVQLYEAGWPLRWAPTTPDGWQENPQPDGMVINQNLSIDQPADEKQIDWIRYRHLTPDSLVWQAVRIGNEGNADDSEVEEALRQSAHPELITDFNPYNANIFRGSVKGSRAQWRAPPSHLGLNWVGDLGVTCEVDVLESRGQLLLDLVEAGFHFRCTIQLDSGTATLSIVDGRDDRKLEFSATATTDVKEPGEYELRFANVDDQLLLWVDGEAVDFGDSTYDPDQLLGGRESMIPWASPDESGDQGDLAPVGIGARGANLGVRRLKVERDIYYIATDQNDDQSARECDYPESNRNFPRLGLRVVQGRDLFSTPDHWSRFSHRRQREFPIHEDQFFVMGDNSPASKDCRLWREPSLDGGRPGGAYLDRKLLIGKAVFVFWPHSWGGVPGLEKLPGWPNFGDMRLVR